MNMNSNLAISERRSQATSQRIARKILKLRPGFGPQATQQAEILADSGLSPGQATVLLNAMYAPTNALGRGQSNRAKWLVQALRDRYGSRLARVANNAALFKQFVGEIEDVIEGRDNLNECGHATFSFAEMFQCDQVGLTATEIARLLDMQEDCSRVTAKKRLMTAVSLVEKGQSATVDGALFQAGTEWD